VEREASKSRWERNMKHPERGRIDRLSRWRNRGAGTIATHFGRLPGMPGGTRAYRCAARRAKHYPRADPEKNYGQRVWQQISPRCRSGVATGGTSFQRTEDRPWFAPRRWAAAGRDCRARVRRFIAAALPDQVIPGSVAVDQTKSRAHSSHGRRRAPGARKWFLVELANSGPETAGQKEVTFPR